jgi:serine/threonine-protein kinase
MLAGKPPFSGDSLAAVIYAIVHGPHVPLTSVAPGVPRGVAAAVDRALAKKADDRFPDIGAFIEGVTGRPLETLRGAEGSGGAGAPAPRPAPSRPATVPMGTTDPLGATAASASGMTVPPAPPVTTAPTQTTRRSPAAAIVVGVVALAAIGAGVVMFRSRAPVVEPAAPPSAFAPPPVAPAPAAVPPPAAPAFQDEPHGPPPPQPPVEAKRSAESRPAPAASGGKRASGRGDAEAVPAAAAAELAQAEEALARGNTAEAIRLAQHSLYAGKSSRAFAIMTKARCRQGDLGGARAALGQVAATQRGAVLRDCAAHGMDLR